MNPDSADDATIHSTSLDDVRARVMALSDENRQTLLEELQDWAIRAGRPPTDRRVVFWLNDLEKPTHVRLAQVVPLELVAQVLLQLRRVSPHLKPIAWARARLFDMHEELEVLWRSSHLPFARAERADLFRTWRVVKGLAVSLARSDQKGLEAMSVKAEQVLKDSTDGDLTEPERNSETRPGAYLIDHEYGGQGALFCGDIDDRSWWFGEAPVGLADDSALTAEAVERLSVRFAKTAGLGAGKGATAESAVRWLRLIYPVCKIQGLDLAFLLCGRGWGTTDDDWAPQDSRLWNWVVRINDAALAKSTAPLFESLNKPASADQYRPEFEPRRVELREAVEQWLSELRARNTDPTADDFEQLLKRCCYALGCESKSVDNLFAAKSKRQKHKSR